MEQFKTGNEKLLFKLLIDNGISYGDLKSYSMLHVHEVYGIRKILDKKETRDKQLFLTALCLVAQDNSDKFINFCNKEFFMDTEPDFSKESIILLLASFKYNTIFYSIIYTLCKDIKTELNNNSIEGDVNEINKQFDETLFQFAINLDYNPYFTGPQNEVLLTAVERRRGIRKGDLDKIYTEIEKYENILNSNPNDFITCIKLSCLYNTTKEKILCEKSIKYCTNVLSQDSLVNFHLAAFFTRGMAYSLSGNTEKSINDLEAVLKFNIQDSYKKIVYYTMGKTYWENENLEKSILNEIKRLFTKVKEIDPDFADVNNKLMELDTLL